MINTGSLMFGNPAKYIQLDPGHAADSAPSSLAAPAQDTGSDEWNAALHVSAILLQNSCRFAYLTALLLLHRPTLKQELLHSAFARYLCASVLHAAASTQRACHVYQDRNYNFLTDNCHAFVAYFMNELEFGGTKKWDMVRLVSGCVPPCSSSPKTPPTLSQMLCVFAHLSLKDVST